MGAYENQAMEAGPSERRRRKKILRLYSRVIRVVAVVLAGSSVGLACCYISDTGVKAVAAAVSIAAGLLINHFCSVVSRANK